VRSGWRDCGVVIEDVVGYCEVDYCVMCEWVMVS